MKRIHIMMRRALLATAALSCLTVATAQERVVKDIVLDYRGTMTLEDLMGSDRLLADSVSISGQFFPPEFFKQLRNTCMEGRLSGIDLGRTALVDKGTGICDHAFDFGDFKPSEGHPGLACVTLPKDTRRIGSHAFRNTQMESIEIPRTVSLIGDSAFEACRNLRDIYIRCTTPPAASGAFVMETLPQDMTLHVPAGTSDLYRSAGGWSTFGNIVEDSRCFVTLEVELDDGETLGEAIAERSATFDSISIKGYLSHMDVETLSRELKYGKLTGINLSGARLEGNTFPNNGLHYMARAYCYIRQLMYITLPEGLEHIDKYAFIYSGIKGIRLPSTLKTLGKKSFYKTKLTGILEIPEGVTDIKSECFSRCGFLKGLKLPSTLNHVEEGAFWMWYDFWDGEPCKDFTISANMKTPVECTMSDPEETDEDAGIFRMYSFIPKVYQDIFDCVKVYVPVGCAQDYRQSYDWCMFGNIVEAEWLDGGTDDISIPLAGSTFEDDTVTVLTTDGRVVYEGKDMPQLGRGLYIVRMGGKTVKMAR